MSFSSVNISVGVSMSHNFLGNLYHIKLHPPCQHVENVLPWHDLFRFGFMRMLFMISDSLLADCALYDNTFQKVYGPSTRSNGGRSQCTLFL